MAGIESVFQQLTRMQWSDYLDILIVAFLIYRLLPLFRTNSAIRIFRVVIPIIVVAWLTEALKLYALSYILNQFLAIGLIALVVLFQPELRRMLDHLGSMRLSKFLSGHEEEQAIDAVISHTVRACETMSHQKIGALIVFARENRLDDIFKNGTQIDAQVSDQLIRNIFFPKAALHDGAMIIRDGRVAAAGCVLPLSDTQQLSADLGTRHRAGVGMSEMTDAVVVIVSEETGTISVAVGGMLKRHLASQTLEKVLHKELCPKQPEQEDNAILWVRQLLKLNKKGERDNEK